MITYLRVLPRDLFNEAKLLKCMGRLCLLIHDELTPVPMEMNYNGDPFDIKQTVDGNLFIDNLHIKIGDIYPDFYTTLNSKENYPLYVCYDEEDYEVFDETGEFTEEFIKLCEKLK